MSAKRWAILAVIVCVASLTWFVWVVHTQTRVIDWVPATAPSKAPAEPTEQKSIPVPKAGSQGGGGDLKPQATPRATNEPKSPAASSQYPPGYDYNCPSGSYPIGDGQCKQEPSYCADGMQSEKCYE